MGGRGGVGAGSVGSVSENLISSVHPCSIGSRVEFQNRCGSSAVAVLVERHVSSCVVPEVRYMATGGSGRSKMCWKSSAAFW